VSVRPARPARRVLRGGSGGHGTRPAACAARRRSPLMAGPTSRTRSRRSCPHRRS
jgi:hypothetical protein